MGVFRLRPSSVTAQASSPISTTSTCQWRKEEYQSGFYQGWDKVKSDLRHGCARAVTKLSQFNDTSELHHTLSQGIVKSGLHHTFGQGIEST